MASLNSIPKRMNLFSWGFFFRSLGTQLHVLPWPCSAKQRIFMNAFLHIIKFPKKKHWCIYHLKRHLLEIVENAEVEDVIPILAVANKCQTGNDPLLTKCLEIVARSDVDHTTFEKDLPTQVVVQLVELWSQLGLEIRDTISTDYKNIKRIQRALDSDDVELVRMLLTEGPVTLDDAYAENLQGFSKKPVVLLSANDFNL